MAGTVSDKRITALSPERSRLELESKSGYWAELNVIFYAGDVHSTEIYLPHFLKYVKGGESGSSWQGAGVKSVRISQNGQEVHVHFSWCADDMVFDRELLQKFLEEVSALP